jgi:hypothetical protein
MVILINKNQNMKKIFLILVLFTAITSKAQQAENYNYNRRLQMARSF